MFTLNSGKCLLLLICATISSSGCVATQAPSPFDADTQQKIQEKATELKIAGTNLKRNQRLRLEDLFWPIAAKNLPICGDFTQYAIGVELISEFNFKGSDEVTLRAKESYEFDLRPQVLHVVKESPGAQIDLKPRDKVLRIGHHIFDPENAREFTAKAQAHLGELVAQGSPFVIGWDRNGSKMESEVVPQEICQYQLKVSGTDDINAWTNGYLITFSQGILEYSKQDIFLQAIFAHELAHGIYKHQYKRIPKGIAGLLLDIYALTFGVFTNAFFTVQSLNVRNKPFEREADYVSQYLLANAGLDYRAGYAEWVRYLTHYKGGEFKSSSHPSIVERLVMKEKFADEIDQKIKQGKPLLPE